MLKVPGTSTRHDRVATACEEYFCVCTVRVLDLGGASTGRLTERVAPPALGEGQPARDSQVEYSN